MVDGKERWDISKERKDELIQKLTPELKMLRVKADITQEKLANIIGLSRQTYSQIETGNKLMTWNTYLSLIFFYNSVSETSKLLTALDIYPDEFSDSNFPY
jgi:DNA-binding XRE family transcriptional regulator